ncbi:zinc-binding alcohol dehydrogenase family protein [Metabacillus sp. Hm71]|uniref:zinc-binding alcohol dehydrogenase family protein n=1 Tax=Metabacillus sp. Hm71 TaxID=3450743 RepID=UPI003F43541A
MKAAVMTKPFTIEFQDVAKPEVGPNDVLVRIKAAGICGSDVHFYDGSNPYANYPQIFGHELSGIIEEIGSEVKDRGVGERVVIEPAVPCGDCYPCRIGKTNVCVNIRMIGSVKKGGFADYLALPENYVHVMPDDMSFEVGALCEPFTIGAQAIDRTKLKDGQTVTILGMGPIGLNILAQIKRQYHVTVYAVDVVPERLTRAKEYGADVVVNSKETDVIQAIDEMTNGEGSNIVIESAGIPLTIEQTVHLVSAGGRIVIVGLTGEEITLPGLLLTKKDIELHGTKHSVNKYQQVLNFLQNNKDIAENFISSVLPFEQIEEAILIAKNHPNTVTKVILTY